MFILAIFLALHNYLTPSGRVTVTGRVVEVTPNLTGRIISIPVKTNVLVKANDVLFQIDPSPSPHLIISSTARLPSVRKSGIRATIRKCPGGGSLALQVACEVT
jgi:hypothetical protein